MPKRESPSSRTTLYRLKRVPKLIDAIRAKYLDSGSFEATKTAVSGRKALLVHGAMSSDQASWASRLSDLSGIEVRVGNETAAGVLLIRDGKKRAFALSYGMGFQLLDQNKIDQGFGLRIAVRTAAPEFIKSLTRSELDHRARVDRSSIPAGETLRGFGIGDFGEMVTRLSGSTLIPGLVLGDNHVQVRAADALSIPLAKSPTGLVSDLDAISEALKLDVKTELRNLEQFVRVRNKTRIAKLEKRLKDALHGKSDARLALAWPHEHIDENGTPSSFKLLGLGHHHPPAEDGLPELEDLTAALTEKNPDDLLAATGQVKVQLYRDSDGAEAISTAIPVSRWLYYEVELGGTRYCFFDAKWFAIDNDYADRLQRHVDEIFSRPAPVALPTWDSAEHGTEALYNEAVARDCGFAMLDRQLIRTTQHPRGFEACDLISPHGDLIHVKHVPRSSAASHLIGQAVVATDALRYDEEARGRLRERVVEADGEAEWLPQRVSSIVLGIAREGGLSASDLFSFSQVTLARLDSWLSDVGATLTVAPIDRT
ncbi:MAG: TIGR04141 family sporadically distributed protein [Acidimicrobiaceae bacterium]|nr:TIGR04141 family sporadically distributed protein [Acidimicrobiaceae bacterium]